MKKVANLRFPVIIAIALAVGVLLGYLFIFEDISLVWIAAVMILTAAIVIFCVIKKHYKLLFIVLFAGMFLTAGALNCYLRLENYATHTLADEGQYTICATVSEKGENSRGEYVILKNVSANGEKADGKIIAYLGEAYGDFCEVGYLVTFCATLTQNDVFIDGNLNYYAQENVKYSCKIYGGLTAKYGFSFFGSIRTAVHDALYDNLDNSTAAILYAMLTGNTQGVDDGAMTSFRYGGIAHIFAVSGLHIGIIYGLLSLLFRKIELNKYVAMALNLFIVLFYAGVCGFTLSSLRAVIMCTVSAVTRLIHKKYDSLNALALSVIIIVLITPFSMFAVGFQLSVCAMLSIILLSNNLSRCFKKLPKKLASTVSVALSAQAGTLPVMLANFGYVSGAGLIMNILVLPLLSVLFVILFLFTVVATIISAAAPFILPVAAMPLEFIVSLFLNIGFENALLSGFGTGLFAPIFYIGLLALSDKVNLKLHQRITAVIVTACVLCVYVLLFNL